MPQKLASAPLEKIEVGSWLSLLECLEVEVALESRIEIMLFLMIARQTERLQVTNVVRPASRQWNNVVNTEMHL